MRAEANVKKFQVRRVCLYARRSGRGAYARREGHGEKRSGGSSSARLLTATSPGQCQSDEITEYSRTFRWDPTLLGSPTGLRRQPVVHRGMGLPRSGRSTTAGRGLRSTRLSSGSSGLGGIAAGPDGRPVVRRVPKEGDREEHNFGHSHRIFRLPSGRQPYSGIVAGPNGNLWFTDLSTSKIGKITTAGGWEYSLPVGSIPTAITKGPMATCGSLSSVRSRSERSRRPA